MKLVRHINHRFARREEGATLIEFGIAVPLLLLFMFGILDFGRLYWNESMAQKATAMAARIAAVRPPACLEVVQAGIDRIDTSTVAYGAFCRTSGACKSPAPVACTLSPLTVSAGNGASAQLQAYAAAASLTRAEMWSAIETVVPPTVRPEDIVVTYRSDPYGSGMIGFVGGPYTPIVTVEIWDDTLRANDSMATLLDQNATRGWNFKFVSPLGQLGALAAGQAYAGPNDSWSIVSPSMSASMTAEDMNHGPKPRTSP